MSGSELGAIFRLEFYKKQYKWSSQPSHRISQRDDSETDASASATSTSLRLRRSRPNSAQSHSSSQLNTTYSVEDEDEGAGDAPYAESLPQPRFVDDFVDSWVHAASSCSSRDAEADGLYALEPELEFCAGAAGAPHSSELNLYHPPTPAPMISSQARSCTPCAINAAEREEDCISTIPAECDVSRPPPPLQPPPPPLVLPRRSSPNSRSIDQSALSSNVCVANATWDMNREWTLNELAAVADAELRAAAAHANRYRSLVALCHRLAPHHYLPLSAVACCPLCGGRADAQCSNAPAPPPRGRGHLPRMAPLAPLDVGQWARVQSLAMVTRYH